MPMGNEYVIITPDLRGRITLGKLLKHRHYRATIDERGTVTLEPVDIVPATGVASAGYGGEPGGLPAR